MLADTLGATRTEPPLGPGLALDMFTPFAVGPALRMTTAMTTGVTGTLAPLAITPAV